MSDPLPGVIELAAADRRIIRRSRVSSVLLYLLCRLNFTEFRRVRVTVEASRLGMRAETMGRAMRELRAAGYLERGPKVLDVWTFRLRDRPNSQPGEPP